MRAGSGQARRREPKEQGRWRTFRSCQLLAKFGLDSDEREISQRLVRDLNSNRGHAVETASRPAELLWPFRLPSAFEQAGTLESQEDRIERARGNSRTSHQIRTGKLSAQV